MAEESVVEVINRLLTDWASPREPTYMREANLSSTVPARCSAEKAKGPLVLGSHIPDDLRDFWGTFFRAILFEDINYGQWGLRILDYEMSNQRTREFNRERPEDAVRGDRVIGEFIGDFDQLVIRCDTSASDFGSIVVAIADGRRNEFYRGADSFSSFLEEYGSHEGQKYWETQFEGRRESSDPPT